MLGLSRDNGKENGNYYVIIGYILATSKLCVTRILGSSCHVRRDSTGRACLNWLCCALYFILGVYSGYRVHIVVIYRENGKDNGNHYLAIGLKGYVLGLCGDNGNGSYLGKSRGYRVYRILVTPTPILSSF